jgi:hypothetical protein
MTRERMANISAAYIDGVPASHREFYRRTLERQYLANCWIPIDMAAAWCRAKDVAGEIVQRVTRQAKDDSEALEEMRKLVSKGDSVRAAADHVAATWPLVGNSKEAYADRLRHKFAAERKRDG